jgi:hypothetical protein
MRRIALIASVLAPLLFAFATANAETSAERADVDALPAPTAADVISRLYLFDLFQQNAVDRADDTAPNDILTTAASRAEAAVKRDKALAELEHQTGTSAPAPKRAAMQAHSLASADRSDGPSYVREFYTAQLAEYELTVALIEHYLLHPDNEDVRSFAATQLSALRSELSETRSALEDK